ncbi:RNA polymerase sigma-70 factor [Arenibacter sp. F26102]|uniref:RNA polymerase sigma-70 factor n=1 Tax=Arenibacter sp. F26102 TaxID=2926416 RepID=UPI001FF131E6|nr:RNA polymerase sigma-70 factor [Arenibacter sp. F26102]MCK0147228.1 RNA polymerase sigma-70 factor [Arenibacter sp. F26102]
MPPKNENIKGESNYLLNINNNGEFDIIFKLYYPRLLLIANNYVASKEEAEEIVQEVFIKLWKNRSGINIKTNNINGYLFKMVKNGCLDYLRKSKRKLDLHGSHKQIEDALNYEALSDNDASDIIVDELAEQIRHAIDLLPEKCKDVFVKSRIDGLAHKDISEKLHISVKTVENHIGRAIKHMRFHLQDYLNLF